MRTKMMNHRLSALAERLAGRLLHVQQRLATWLNRRTQHWDQTSKLIALGLFLSVFGSASLWLIIQALNP